MNPSPVLLSFIHETSPEMQNLRVTPLTENPLKHLNCCSKKKIRARRVEGDWRVDRDWQRSVEMNGVKMGPRTNFRKYPTSFRFDISELKVVPLFLSFGKTCLSMNHLWRCNGHTESNFREGALIFASVKKRREINVGAKQEIAGVDKFKRLSSSSLSSQSRYFIRRVLVCMCIVEARAFR